MDVFPRQYWKANPHQWGPGKIHIIHEDGEKTVCGKLLSKVPGRHIPANSHNCEACTKVLETAERREQQEREWEQRQKEWAAQRAAAGREWRKQHNAYLQTPEWRRRHDLVMARENYLCESCRINRATEVHHTTYDHWKDEPLWELRAICRKCNEKITMLDRMRRGVA